MKCCICKSSLPHAIYLKWCRNTALPNLSACAGVSPYAIAVDFEKDWGSQCSCSRPLQRSYFHCKFSQCNKALTESDLPSFLISAGTLLILSSSISSCQRLASCPSSGGSSRIPGLLYKNKYIYQQPGFVSK